MKKYYGYIYKIVCKTNGKVYIGQTIRPIELRWKNHVYESKKRTNKAKMKISRAIKKYGEENFNISILCKANTREELNYRERMCIRIFDSIKNGYNISEGGAGPIASEETRAKMSAASKGKKKPEGFGQKIRDILTGTKHTKERIIKMSLSQKGDKGSFYGRHHTEDHKKRMSTLNTGKKMSEESNAKISKANKGRKHSEDVKRKLKIARSGRKPNLGKKHSEESKLKISVKSKENNAKRYIKIECLENNITYSSYQHAADSLGMKKHHITSYFQGKTKTAKGFTFKKITC